MQQDHDELENIVMPSSDLSGVDPDLDLTEKALEVAQAQTVVRDVDSATLGNLFAFFALLFPPLIASTLDLTARARGTNKNTDSKSD